MGSVVRVAKEQPLGDQKINVQPTEFPHHLNADSLQPISHRPLDSADQDPEQLPADTPSVSIYKFKICKFISYNTYIRFNYQISLAYRS